MRLAGVELYFDDLDRARTFYRDVLGLSIIDEQAGHYAKFDAADGFVCAECKGSETYPSLDKAVLFFEVENVDTAIQRIGAERFARKEDSAHPRWAVLHDPEGHNILLLARGGERAPERASPDGNHGVA